MMTHLSEYLDYYGGLEKPGYAVLVTGAWGVGKTWQVKKAIPPEKLWYVSLYGLSSVREIDAAVFAEAHPNLNKAKELVGGLGKTVQGVSEVLGAPVVGGFISDALGAIARREIKPNGHVLVFDDLERSSIKTDDLLGVINQYVEHRDFRVVVIAHDEKLEQELADKKEKIFGQQISAEPETEAAMECFIREVKAPAARKFIRRKKPDILSVFKESEEPSLRILRHVILDLGRLYCVIDPKFRKRDEEILEVVKLFTAFDIEVRSGGLSAKGIWGRDGYHGLYDNGETPISKANERYSSVDLEEPVLNNKILTAFLINGHYCQGLLSASLSESPLFSDPAELRPWQVVVRFDSLAEEEVQSGVKRLQQEFTDRAVTDPGEMLHVFALRMLLAEKEEIPGDIKKAADEAIAYINDLLQQERLQPHEPEQDMESYGGWAYWVGVAAKPHFQRIKKHLEDSQIEAYWRNFATQIDEVLKQVRTDGDKFMSDFGTIADSPKGYSSFPVLKKIPPDKFVEAWIEGHPANAVKIKQTLQQRCPKGVPRRSLKAEIPWMKKVIAGVDAEAAKKTGLPAYRVKRLVPFRFNKSSAQTDK